jgi:3-ketosteroid 9alpha-monooxygenase subunit B
VGDVHAVLRELRRESADAGTLRLDLQGTPFPYRAGQYVLVDPHQFDDLADEIRVREAQRGKPLGPGYFSLSSDALDPSVLEITVKVSPSAPPGLLPAFLLRLVPGRWVWIRGPGGSYGLPEEPPPGITGFLHLCAGSGIAPNRGMIRHALGRGWPQKHLLLQQDRTASDILFRSEWALLSEKHPEQFRVRHILSGDEREYIHSELLRRLAGGFLDLHETWAFICGPNTPRPDGTGFVDRTREMLKSAFGFSAEHIRAE